MFSFLFVNKIKKNLKDLKDLRSTNCGYNIAHIQSFIKFIINDKNILWHTYPKN